MTLIVPSGTKNQNKHCHLKLSKQTDPDTSNNKPQVDNRQATERALTRIPLRGFEN